MSHSMDGKDVLAGNRKPFLNFPVFDAISNGHSVFKRGARDFAGVFFVAFPWFWPILFGPLPAMGPDIAAWASAALLVCCLPAIGSRITLIVALGLLLAAVGSSVLGLLQYFDLEDVFFPWVVPTLPGYVLANVHQINMLATLLSVGLLCVWHLVREGLVRPVAACFLASIIVMALAATASRTGLLHLIAMALLLCFWHRAHVGRVALISLAVFAFYALASLLLPWLLWVTRGIEIDRDIFSRFGAAALCHSRWVLWGNMLELISLKPWTGWGSGGVLYAHYITPYDGLRFCEKLSNAHNLPLHLMVVFGVPLALLLGSLLFAALVWLKPWTASKPTNQMGWSILALIGLHSMLEYPLWFGSFQLMAGLAMLLVFVGRKGAHGQVSTGVQLALPDAPGTRAFVTSIALSLLGFLVWDYLKVSQLYLPESLRMERYKVDTFDKARDTTLFREHVLIAQVVATEITAQNAELMLQGALQSLHVAPDPRIIQRVIETALFLGRGDVAQLHSERYRAAWPKEFTEWERSLKLSRVESK